MKKLVARFQRWLAYRRNLQREFWYILYEDGTGDGGLIQFDDVFWKLGDYLEYRAKVREGI